jgi:hypothetical protein
MTGLANSQQLKCIPDPAPQLKAQRLVAQRNQEPPGRLYVNQLPASAFSAGQLNLARE